MSYLNVVLVLWRELFEALLIVTIVYAFLSRRLAPAQARRLVTFGVGGGVLLSVLLAAGLFSLAAVLSAEALDHFQTAVLLVCAGLMTHMCLWMQRHARTLKSELEASLGDALTASRRAAVILLMMLAVAREGFEAVVYLYGMGMSHPASGIAFAVLGALALAGLTSVALSRGFKLVSPRRLFKVTGIFLLLTAASLVVTAMTRLIQAGIVPPLVDQIWDTSALLDDRSSLGQAFAGITGYQATPALITVLAYAAYWMSYGALRQWSRHPAPARVAAAVAATGSLLVVGTLLAPAPARAQGMALKPEDLKLKLSGYGDMQFAYYDYGPLNNGPDGAPREARSTFDATRFAAELEGFYVPFNVEFEAEVEFEHGGTGTDRELNQRRTVEDPYENDIEHGGEVFLEEFFLKKYFGSDVSIAAGRLMVGVGLIPLYNKPTDYLAVQRDETEIHIIPEEWSEMGFQLQAELKDVRVLVQAINGMDSTGFSSDAWVAMGQQGSFEGNTATDMAGVLRVDFTGLAGAELGASCYYGNTSRDRPEPSPLLVSAPVTIVDVHARLRRERLRGAGEVLWGHLQNADKITLANNQAIPESLDAPQTPVGSGAAGAYAELGYDVGTTLGAPNYASIAPFLRYDLYDTMYQVAGAVVKNPRSARRVVTIGIAADLSQALVAKFDVSHRSFGASNLRQENTAELGLGFVM